MTLLHKRIETPLLYLLIAQLVFWVVFSYLSLTQYWSLKNQMNDLGNLIQPLWYTAQGKILYMTNTVHDPSLEGMTRLAGHANWLFLFLVPVYLLGSVPLLLVLYVGLVSVGALGLYLLAKNFGASQKLALLPAVAYLVSPQIHDAVLYDLHASTLALPLVIWAVYFWHKRAWKLAVPLMVLAASAKEDMALVMAGLGGLDLISKRWRSGLAIGLGFGLYTLLMVAVVMPGLEPQSQASLIESRYAPNPEESWLSTVARLTQFDVAVVLLVVIVSTGGLALKLDWWWSLAVVHLAINFLSQNQITREAYGYYYQAPLLVIGLLVMSKALGKSISPARTLVALVLICGHSLWLSPAPYSLVSSWQQWIVPEEAKAIRRDLALLDPQASVSVQNNLGPYLAERNSIISFPYRADTADMIVVALYNPYPETQIWPRQRNFVFLTQLQPDRYQEEIIKALENPNYGVTTWTDEGLLVLEKGADHSASVAVQKEVEARLVSLFSAVFDTLP